MLERKAKIVCTIGRIENNRLKEKIIYFIKAGMDVARINMAHYNSTDPNDKQYLKDLIGRIRTEGRKYDKFVAIMGDIQGPKVRITEFLGDCQNEEKVPLTKHDEFTLTSETTIPTGKKGARIGYEGRFDFFQDIKTTVQTDKQDKPKPIEFWFADGKVIIEAKYERLEDTSVTCNVIVEGELKKGEGVSVKNAMIKPGEYTLENYPKDMHDINFLLEQDIDFLALSFVNSKDDLKNLQHYIKLKIHELELPKIEERFFGMKDFPIISKIETIGGISHIDEIMEVSYGIMVARGDLALRTGIQKIGIYQKKVIDRCLTKGIPVITATQMLLSMMEFKEPRRSEATDVTNAIFDGTDALMLSEETADSESKFQVESIQMMADIAMETEKEIKDLNKLEYEYKIGQRFTKIRKLLDEEASEIKNKYNDGKTMANEYEDYEDSKVNFARKETTDNISHNACQMAYDAKRCEAIVVLTDTGGTARMVSRFRPDMPIFAGVYNEQIGRILSLSYGVKAFIVKERNSNYPFDELMQIVEQAKKKNLLKSGDKIIQVAGFPSRRPGTVTFINDFTINEN